MTLTVRLPDGLEQQLAEYCTTYRVTRSAAVKRALEDLLKPRASGESSLDHPFIGGDKGDGTDLSGNIKAALRTRFRKSPR